LPIIGNLLAMSSLPHRSLASLAERYGPLMTVRLGTNLVIVASSPSTAREILQTHCASLSGRSAPPDAWRARGHSDNSIFVLQPSCDGDHKWRTVRRLGMAQLLSPRRLEEQEPLRRDVVRGLLRDVSEQAAASGAGGAPVSVGRVTFAAMVRLLGRAMFSAELDAVTSQEIHDCVREAIVLFTAPNVSDFFPAVAAADVQGLRRRMSTLIARSYQVMDRQIEQRLQERGVGGARDRANDLLDVMLDMSESQEVGSGLTVNRALMRAFFTVSRKILSLTAVYTYLRYNFLFVCL
jgi:cytochrome P450